MALNLLANGLHDAARFEDALSVRVAVLSMERRCGGSESNILIAQGNLACTYQMLGRVEPALEIYRDVYSGNLRLDGEEHEQTLRGAYNYAGSLSDLKRFEEAKSLFRRTIPVAQRVLGADNQLTIRMRRSYAMALHDDPSATLDDLREAVTTLEDMERIARRVLGVANPFTLEIAVELRQARANLRHREETPPAEDLAEEVD